ncbi:hypothetical protein TWF225_000389 [Orbilia oligospora]|nr:hypothetical protein TWF225_000389 [Orbilia oligospora]KAF3254123.1 hypothetical protein TWF128_006252 [Orbilia oligospora]KAF3272049.1 hypothetical protein TWF217_003864 [Orbilia oligospora]KAF3297785.1 hypothetical protein TWF132_006182 [Orbilia oligospora]
MDPIPGTFHNQEANVGLQANSVNITGGVTINGADAAAASQKEKEIKILGALHKSIEKNRKDRNPDRVPGTCEWFTTHQTFRDWKSSPSSKILWVSADPGSGKSVLAKYLVDSILPSTEARTTCYFFFKDDFEGQGSAVTALCCILYQLFSKQRTLLSKEIIESFEIAGEGFSSNFTELWNAFIIAIKDKSAGEVVCILDALDECKGNERSELIGKLQQLYREKNKSNIKFLVTSRPIFEIRNGLHHQEIPESSLIHLSGESEAEILKISQEIGIFIEARVEGIGEKAGLTRAERSMLLGKLTSVKNRTYLWVYLTLNLIESDPRMNIGISENRIQNITSHLPTTVNEAYERILSSSRDLGEAKLLLKILIAAARPLRLREMRLAMQLAAGDNYHSYKELGMIMGHSEQRIRDYIRDLCGLFVVVIESAVYLIHQTAKEFLVSNDRSGADQRVGQSLQWRNSLHVWDCHLVLFYACARHLFFAEFESDPLSSEESVPEYCEKYVFLDYSASHWAAHLRNSRINLVGREAEWILGLCDATSKRCITWFRVYWAGTNTNFPSGATTLIIASYFGLLNIVKPLLKSRLDERAGINGVDSEYRRSALSWAAENGFDNVIEELLKVPRWKGISVMVKRKAKVNIVDAYGRTPLTYAVWGRHITVIKQLLEAGARMDLKDDVGGTPTSYAICSGSDDVIQQLFKRADGIDSRERGLITGELLRSASEKGREDVLELLLGTGHIDIDSRDRGGRTALMESVRWGHYRVALLLINNGANIEAAADDGWTPLTRAAQRGDEKMIQLLLESNANIEAADSKGRTPLIHATIEGHQEIVELLLESNAKIEVVDSEGRTPLIHAAGWGHREVVELLLERGADVNATDMLGWTPVTHAADEGRDEVVWVLLRRMDHAWCWEVVLDGRVRRVGTGMVRSLLRSGLDMEAVDKFGGTPLARAIEMDYTGLAEILVNGGANMEAADRDGMTPLALAVRSGSWLVAGLLLDKGASVRTTDHNGCTPLHHAVNSYEIFNEQILSRLLANGADIEAADKNGFTPLFRAVEAIKHHHYLVNGVRALIKRGASIKTRIIHGEPYSLLYEAIGANNLFLVELLLDEGADIEERGKSGPTPLFYALRMPSLSAGVLQSLLRRGAKREVKGAKGQALMACVELNTYNESFVTTENSSLHIVKVQDEPGGPWATNFIHDIEVSDYL